MPRFVIVVSKDNRSTSNQFCNSIGAEGDTFTVPLYTGDIHTHYWCNWLMTDEQRVAVKTEFTLVFDTPEEALQTMGLNIGSLEELD